MNIINGTKKIVNDVRNYLSNNEETLFLSCPFLKRIESKFYIAFYYGTVKDNNLMLNNKLIIADVVTGAVISSIPRVSQIKELDYIKEADTADVENDFYDEIFIDFSAVRQCVIERPNSNMYKPIYNEYKQKVLGRVPEAYRNVFEDRKSSEVETTSNKNNPNAGIKSVKWTPNINLSVLPEFEYRFVSELAKHIKFIKPKNEGEIAFSYPVYCFETNHAIGENKYEQLLSLARSGKLELAHFRHMTRNTIFVKCANAKKQNCIYNACPYVMAAYVKYLKETNLNELSSQRAKYKSERYFNDWNYYSDDLKYSFDISKITTDKQELERALKDLDARNIVTDYSESEKCLVIVDNRPRRKHKTVVIDEGVLLSGEVENGTAKDFANRVIDSDILNAVIADWLIKSGNWVKFSEKASDSIQGNYEIEKAKKESETKSEALPILTQSEDKSIRGSEKINNKPEETKNNEDKGAIPESSGTTEPVKTIKIFDAVKLQEAESTADSMEDDYPTSKERFFRAAEQAKNEFFGFIDTDDLFSPEVRSTIVKLQTILSKKDIPLYIFKNNDYLADTAEFEAYHENSAIVLVGSYPKGNEMFASLYSANTLKVPCDKDKAFKVYNEMHNHLLSEVKRNLTEEDYPTFLKWYEKNLTFITGKNPAEIGKTLAYIGNATGTPLHLQ